MNFRSDSKDGASMSANHKLEIEMGCGVVFPNWSVVESDRAGEALTGILQAFDVENCWSGLGPDEDRARRAILSEFAATGQAPSMARLGALTKLPIDRLAGLLKSLGDRDLIVRDEGGENITGAYPFTERETGHRISLGGVSLNAMCAIDALGAGAMCRTDTVIDSSCRNCGRPIHIETRDDGAAIESATPDRIIVWSGIQATNGCSADTMCAVMAFFCGDACLDGWRKTNAAAAGHRLSLDEGMQVGKAIFTALLADAPIMEGKAEEHGNQ